MCSLASAISVELLVSLLNHEKKNGAIADEELNKCDRGPIGPIPHQIRGDMSEYKTQPMCGEAFNMCISCSEPILENFRGSREQAINFVKQACNQPNFLEDVTGITEKLKNMNFDDIDDFDIDLDEDELALEELATD